MRPLLSTAALQKHGASSELIVVLHGYTRTARDMQPLVDLVGETHPDADILCPGYPAGWLANTNPEEVAREISMLIDANWAPSHQRVVLLGHSAGGLLLRRALLIGREASQAWAARVERVVLLAGLNRGWSLDERPAQMSRSRYTLYRLAIAFASLISCGRFIRALQRGSPIIADVRIRWMDQERHTTAAAMPLVVQVLGSRDDIVAPADSIDVQAGDRFRYLEVRETGHLDIIRLDEPTLGAYRRTAICNALTKRPEALSQTASASLTRVGVDETVTDFVFIRHGIRDFGHWGRHLAERVRAVGVELNRTVESETSGYGFFPMGPFLIWSRRQRHVRRFLDEYTGAIAKYPRARIHFIGHSNGTYLLAGALEGCPSVRFAHVVLAGSVMPTWYPWNRIGTQENRVAAVRNHVGSADWVVAIFPRLYEFLRQLMGLRWRSLDIGSAGFNDFEEDFGRRNSVLYARGGHGGALARENLDALARFALAGDAATPLAVTTPSQWGVVSILGRLCWLVWLAIAGAIVSLGWLVSASFGGWALVLFALFVLLLLNSI